ncbi:MAG TPA: sigma-70 family RNA polymerase sigma factor [Armatimonadota bacterium]|nr:sigma-70 family RNA polymerase sigma factor [Armatimonadota bacterium]
MTSLNSDCSVQNNMHVTEESELVKRAKSGDLPAFESLYRSYNTRLFNFARQITCCPDDAADVVQETFIKAWNALPRLRSDSVFGAWLHRIALNLARDTARKRPVVIDPEQIELDCGEPDPENSLISAESENAVYKAISGLKEEHRLVVTMHYMGGMGVDAIAEVMGVPKGTVMSRLSRARAILRRKLSPYVEER